MAWDCIDPSSTLKVGAFPYYVSSLPNLRQRVDIVSWHHCSGKPGRVKKSSILATPSVDALHKEAILPTEKRLHPCFLVRISVKNVLKEVDFFNEHSSIF